MSLPNLCIRNPSGGRVSRRAPPPSNVAVSQGVTGLLFTSVALGGMFAFFPFFFLREQPASDSCRCFLGFMSFFQSLLVTTHSPDKHLLSRCRGQGPMGSAGRFPVGHQRFAPLRSPFSPLFLTMLLVYHGASSWPLACRRVCMAFCLQRLEALHSALVVCKILTQGSHPASRPAIDSLQGPSRVQYRFLPWAFVDASCLSCDMTTSPPFSPFGSYLHVV